MPGMTSKQRVLTACRHEETDRVPLRVYLTPEIRHGLQEHFGERDIDEALGIDFRGVGAPYRGEIRPGPGLPGEADHYDLWGAGYTVTHYQGGAYSEATELPFAPMDSLAEVEAYPWPSAQDYDFSGLREAAERLGEYAVVFGSAGIPDIVNGVSRGRGMERVLIDIMTRDPVGVAIIDRRVEHYYEYCRRGLEAAGGAIDILQIGEDCGDQRGRLFPPAVFDEFFVPRIRPFIDLAHEHGALAMLHSCGDTHEIMPTFIEMGLDILDAMQPEPPGVDPAAIKRLHGDRLTFCGLVSTQQTLPHGTPEDVRAEVRERIEVMGAGGGYILAPAHCI
ncbi:MAG: uroporphyrinogen decarboxylase family protein, partial [Armatimonadota bacterium]